MKKYFSSLVLFFALLHPLHAVAPALALVVTTNAATYSTIASAASSAGTIVTGLALTGLALLSSFKIPTKPTAPELHSGIYFTPGASSGFINQCDRFYQVVVYIDKNNPSRVGAGPINQLSSIPCSSSNLNPTVNQLTSSNGELTSLQVGYYTIRCKTASGCGNLALNQSAQPQINQTTHQEKIDVSSGVADSKLDLSKDSDGSFSYKNDPDVPALVGGESGYPAPLVNGGMALFHTNSSGQNVATVIEPTTQGSYSISEYVQSAPDAVQESVMQIAPDSSVSSHTSTTKAGTVNPVPATSPSTPVEYVPISNPNNNPDPDPDPDPTPQPGSFPSDYARTGEAALASQYLAQEIAKNFQGDLIQPEVSDEDMPWFGDTFDGVLPTINTAGATCPVWQFEALGDQFYIDHHCQLITDFNVLFYSLFTTFWVLLAFRTVMEA